MAQIIKIGDVFELDEFKIGSTNGRDWMWCKIPNAEGKGSMLVFVENVEDIKDKGWVSAKIVDISVKKGAKQVDGKWENTISVNVTLEKVDGHTREGFMNIPGEQTGLPFA